MGKTANRNLKILRVILWCMVFGSFIAFGLGQLIMPNENKNMNTTFHVFRADWVQEKNDGTVEPVKVPGTCDVEYGEWGTITTKLPKNQENTWICVRSMQQELNVYVGDELRKEYSTLSTQRFGKTSTLTYVMFPLYEEDGGKVLRIDFMSKSGYANYVSEIYAGDRADIKDHFINAHAPGLVVALFLFIISLTVVIGSYAVHHLYKIEVDLLHLGNVMLMASTWLIVESKIRQFIFPSSTVAMWMGFLMIALLPFPFSEYINCIQKGRYQKIYTIIELLTAINFTVTVFLQLFNIKDFFEIMAASHALIVLLIIVMVFTILKDAFSGYIKEYRGVAVGFLVAIIGGVCELGLVYVVDARFNGVGLCLGLVAMLGMASIRSVRELINIEKEKQMAIAASASKAQFLANMSHEIRTPINVVIGMNEMILRENRDSVIDEYARSIQRASKMLLGLINDVLDFSKIEAGKLQIVESEYTTETMLQDVVLGAEIRAKQKKLEFKLDIDKSLPSVLKGDDIRIKQVLNNLLSNALKYTEEGSVSFRAKGLYEKDQFRLRFLVEDTGVGIAKEDMEKLFESFQRLEMSKNRYIQGTGLGLNISKQLITQMNGTIEVKSEHGKGSCFIVEIPQQIINMMPIGESNKNSERKEQKEENERFYAPEAKVLVVDDNKMNLKVMQALMKRTGIVPDIADGGNACLQMTENKKYDLILMDHMMPEPDGIQTLHMLRGDKGNVNAKTKVIVLTANAIEGMREKYLAEGFTDYLSKPVEAVKLENMLAKYLKEKAPSSSDLQV